MPNSDFRLKELYLNKPECVITLPEWLFSSEKREAYRAISRLAIVEIAGRDSLAAAVKSVKEESFTDLLPTYVYTGTEHGPWASVEKAVERLAQRMPEVRVHDLLVLGSPNFWRALNGRFISKLVSRWGYYLPCPGCHLYLHSVRIPLALTLGNAPIIAGERERHDERVKVNQIPEALNVYERLANDFGIPLLFPLRHVAEGDHIEEILGFHWQEDSEQLECVLSGNYRRLDRSVYGTSLQVQKCLQEFASPCAKKIIESYAAGHIPNHLEMAASVLRP